MRPAGTFLLCLAACGSSGEPTSRPAAGAVDPASITLRADPAGRAVVAEVNGAPVYADCVEQQAAAHELTPRAALDECIDFELLAQAAEAAGLATHPAVLAARKTEAARAFIDTAFAAEFDGPEDVPADDVRMGYDRFKGTRWVHAEHRHMSFYRFKVAKTEPRGLFRDLAAAFFAHELWQPLTGRSDVSNVELQQRGREIAGDDAEVEGTPDGLVFPYDGVVPEYQKVLFGDLDTPGTVARPTRTPWGWDVILLIEIFPERNVSLEEAEAEVREHIFEFSRQRAFARFLEQLGGNEPELSDYWLRRLAAVDRANASLLGANR